MSSSSLWDPSKVNEIAMTNVGLRLKGTRACGGLTGGCGRRVGQWVALLKSHATDLASTDTVDREASVIASTFNPNTRVS